MKTYAQGLHTGVDNVWDTPKTTHDVECICMGGVRWTHTTHRAFLTLIQRMKQSFSYLVKIKKMINKKTQWLVLIGSLVAMQGANTAHAASPSVDHLKLYAHSRLISFEQFLCFNKIITKESNWRVNAKNGSHFGLGQMKSKWYRNLDGFRQIDQTIKYISVRYSTPCKAWSFHQRNNWF
jgi:hypothetical protein